MQMFQNLHRTMQAHHSLKIRCEVCGHLVTWPCAEAKARCGPDATPIDIRRRSKCKVCRAEGRVQVWF